MTIAQYGSITASDINAIRTKIANEATARVVSEGTALLDARVQNVDYTTADFINNLITRLGDIRTSHCYCQTGQGTVNHYSGNNYTLTANTGDFNQYSDYELSVNVLKINTDIDALVAQCDCDVNALRCTGDTDTSHNCYSEFATCGNCPCNTQCSCVSYIPCTCQQECFGGQCK